MKSILSRLLVVVMVLSTIRAQSHAQDENFHVFLCLGQSKMEGFPEIEEQNKMFDDPRFQILAAVDFPQLQRDRGNWYPDVLLLAGEVVGTHQEGKCASLNAIIADLPRTISTAHVVSSAGCVRRPAPTLPISARRLAGTDHLRHHARTA